MNGQALLQAARTVTLFVVTACAEIGGCYLVWLWLRESRSVALLLPAALSLALFAWLLTLQPFAPGRTYAAYGAVYVVTALVWLSVTGTQKADRFDLAGAALAVAGMAVMLWAPRGR